MNKWILVKDCVPPAFEQVLLQGASGGMFIGEAMGGEEVVKGKMMIKVAGANKHRNAIAWQPLPQPLQV